jgi:hypothetical protein
MNDMKVIMENFSKFVLEIDGQGPLGNYVFPDEDITPDEEAEKEPYSKLESYLEDMLDSHYASGKRPLPRKASDEILKLIKNNNYPDIFKLYTSGEVYRGMAVEPEIFIKLFGKMPQKKKWYKAPIDWWFGRARKSGVKFPFSPKTKPGYSPGKDTHAGSWSSSWTWSQSSAKYFAQELAFDQGEVPVLIVADAGKNTFIDSRPFYERFDFAENFQSEKEVIGVGDISLIEIQVLPVIE